MSQYKVDGFRFDFTKGFTNKAGDGQAYDQSRIDILKRMASEIYKRNPAAIVIMEHLTDNSEEKVLSDADIMLWGNMNNNYCEAIMGYNESSKSDLSWALYKQRGWSKPNLVSYMESHDEERMLYKAKTWGNSSGSYNVKNIATALKRAELCAAFYITIPGPKMIWQFGELGYDYSINTCSNGTSVSEDCRVSEKPIRWDYFDDANRKALYQAYSKLIKLKTENKVFEATDITYSLTGATKYIIWKGTDMKAFVVGNFDVTAKSVTITLPHSGVWYNAITGAAENMSSTTYSVTLNPGEYRLYVDNGSAASIEDETAQGKASISISPNQISYTGADTPKQIAIYDLTGSLLASNAGSPYIGIDNLDSGFYIVKITTTHSSESYKFIKR
jgi:hypothetical protein